jgi:NADH-quinone oxidoreductase subunit F
MNGPRVLDLRPVQTLDDYVAGGGGRGLDAARRLGPTGVMDDLDAAGLRGRGGAGFPTGRKWRTVVGNESPVLPPTVVVNAAEGEPGTFKDRMLLRRNPFRVLEGALVAAATVGADRIVVALKASSMQELRRVRAAAAAMESAHWSDGITVTVAEGPGEYLFGEETALLEVLDGRAPFPRIAPPYRHGVDEVGDGTESAADVAMASPEGATVSPPTLVNNAETLANVPGILAEGPDWFRSVGTAASPGTIVCTVSGRAQRAGVEELPLGTPLREIVERVGGGPRRRRRIVAVMSGVANALVPEDLLDTPATYEDLERIGSGLGAAGFVVFDDTVDMAAVAGGVSRFLAVESCGQCVPCKQDGLQLAGLLDQVCRSEATEHDLATIAGLVGTVADQARCYLASQHQQVVGSILQLFGEHLRAHVDGGASPVVPERIAPIVDIHDGVAALDERQDQKQPDWIYGETWSGQSPADRIDQGVTGSEDS